MANSQVPSSQTYATQVPQVTVGGQRVFKGPVTQSVPPVSTVGTVAATGSTQADAAAVPTTARIIDVTAADNTKGVVLPPGSAGLEIILYNGTASTLKVYPPVGGDINDGSTDAAFSHVTKVPRTYRCIDGTTWSAS